MTVATSATVRNLTSESSPGPCPEVGPEFEAMMHRLSRTSAPRLPHRRPFVCASVRSEPSVTVGKTGGIRPKFLHLPRRVDWRPSRQVVQTIRRKGRLARCVDCPVQPHGGVVALRPVPINRGAAVGHPCRAIPAQQLLYMGPPALWGGSSRVDRDAADDREEMGPGPRHHVYDRLTAATGRQPFAAADLVRQVMQRKV